MRTSTANAIKTLLRMDESVTPDERMAILSVIAGGKDVSPDLSGEVSVADAASYLGMSRTTLWRMCVSGKVATSRRGKKFYIAGAEVARMKSVA